MHTCAFNGQLQLFLDCFYTEYEPLVKQTGDAAVTADLRKVCGFIYVGFDLW